MTISPRTLQSGEDGYFCISEDGTPVLQGEIDESGPSIWVMADQTVQIDKMFGPLVFWPIRVRPDFQTCEWVIEREYGPEGNDWREVARVPGQLDSDFADADA